MYLKRVKYRNVLGELVFDGHYLYCEEIDCCGVGTIANTEQLMNSHGTVTSSVCLAGRSVPCRFKLVDKDGDPYLRERVVRVLSPLIEGELEVQTELAAYTIKCRPTEMPVIRRTDVFYVWQWDTVFYADYPLWQRGSITHEADTVPYNDITVFSASGVEIPLKLRFYSDVSLFFNKTQGSRMNLQNFPVGADWVEVNTKDLTVYDNNGTDRSNCIDPEYNIGSIRLLPGKNVIYSTTSVIRMMWNDYSLGVI